MVQSAGAGGGGARARPSRGLTQAQGGQGTPGVRDPSTAAESWAGVRPLCATGGVRTAPSGRGRDRRVEPGRTGKGRASEGLGSRWTAGRRPPFSRDPRRTRYPQIALPKALGPPGRQRALSPRLSFLGRRDRKCKCESHFRRGAAGWAVYEAGFGDWTSSGQTWPRARLPERSQSASRPQRRVRPPQCRSCTASGGSSSSISRWWTRFWAPWGSRTLSGRNPWTGNSLPAPLRLGTAPPSLSRQTWRGGRCPHLTDETETRWGKGAPGQRPEGWRVRCLQGLRLRAPPCTLPVMCPPPGVAGQPGGICEQCEVSFL